MTPTQEQALKAVRDEWLDRPRLNHSYVEAVFLAGYQLGAAERQAQDARICRELGSQQDAAFKTIVNGIAFDGYRYIQPSANAIAFRIESTPTEPGLRVDAVEPQRAPVRVFDDRSWPLARAAYELGASGAPATDTERDLFEAWMQGHCWQCGEWNGTSYPDMTTRVLWAAWRDRAALASSPTSVEPCAPASVKKGIDLWAVYEHPSDYRANACVARRFVNDQPTNDVIVADNLETIRARLRSQGLRRIPRSAHDDPVIVECWL